MDYIFINKTLKTPIYKQISSAISKAIETGVLAYNDKLPTEKEVCQTFSISPTVVKKAYEDLIKDKKIKRIKGKGTYVTNRFVLKTQMHEYYQVDQKIKEQQLLHTYQTIMLDRVENDLSASRLLNLNIEAPVYIVLRLISANNNPTLLQKIYLNAAYFPHLEIQYDHHYRLYQLVEELYDHKLKHMQNTFSAMNAASSEALLLKIQPDDAIYVVRSKLIDDHDQLLGYVINYFPGEFTELEVYVHAL